MDNASDVAFTDNASEAAITNVIPVWGLMPDECTKIINQVDKLMAQGRASGMAEKHTRTYICIYDQQGAPYTITREQEILQLHDPTGGLIVIGKNIDVIIAMLGNCLPE